MIIYTADGQCFDTQTDLSATERHILQKLMAWQSLVNSISEFKEKRTQAFAGGWNESGPIAERSAMKIIIDDMEKSLLSRLNRKTDKRRQAEDN